MTSRSNRSMSRSRPMSFLGVAYCSMQLVVAGMLTAPLGAQVRTLTFDADDPIGGLSAGTILGNQYAAWGVTFAPNFFSGPGGPVGAWATNTDLTVVSSTGDDVANLGSPSLVSGNIVRSFDGWLAEDGDPSFGATFSEVVDQVSIDFAGNAFPTDLRIFAYNGATLLGTVTGSELTGQERLTFTADAGQQITHVGVTVGRDLEDWVAFDNFTFRIVDATTTVPEPSTWLLTGMGLVAVGIVSKRRANSPSGAGKAYRA